MRKILLLCFALLLAACQATAQPFGSPLRSPTPTETPQPPPTRTPVPATITPTPQWRVPPADLRGVTVRFWHPWTGETAAEVSSLVDTFNRRNEWGLRVEVTAFGSAGALDDAVQASAASTDLPALVATQPEQIAAWQAGNQPVVNLNDYLKDETWQFSGEIYPAFWQPGTDGERLSVPAERSARVLFYNQTWAKELGFNAPPRTSAEFRQQACAAFNALLTDAIPENNGLGGWIVDGDGATILSWMYAFDAEEITSAGAGYPFSSQQTVNAFSFVRGMLDEGCAWKSRLAEPYEYFGFRQALFYTGSLEDIEAQTLTQARLNNRDAWLVLPFPSASGEAVLVTGGLSYAVLETTPAEQMAAWAFIRWMLAPEQQARLAEAEGSLPLSQQTLTQMSVYARAHPQWAAIAAQVENARSEPQDASWHTVRHLLEDAAWQSLQPNITPAQIPEILDQLNAMIVDVLN